MDNMYLFDLTQR